MYLPDTNVFIDVLHRRNSYLIDRFGEVPLAQMRLSVVVIAELMAAVEKGPAATQRTAIRRLRDIYPLESINEEVALAYGMLRAQLESKGRMIGGNDLWIAAQAVAGDYVVVTANTREFERVPGIRLENWVAP